MVPVGLGAVTARIAELQTRFAPPPAFSLDGAGGRSAPLDPPADARIQTPQPTAVELALSQRSAAPTLPLRPAAGTGLGFAGAPAAATAAVVATPAPAAGVGSPSWATALPEAGRPWAGAIADAAAAAGIDPRLLAAVVQHESGFRPDARSHAGAIGLGQLMPATARELGVDPTDPQQNLHGAARYLRAQLDRFGSVELALAAYNAGPGRVARAGGVPRIAETQQYVQRVSATYDRLRSS